MDKIIGVIGGVPTAQTRRDDDFVDRLSHRYSMALMVAFAIIVSTKQYVGEPISCWVPAHFTSNWEEYANSYCWIKNTYYLPFEEYIPGEHDEGRYMITYYQWVPLILLTQALLFFLPVMVWRAMNSHSGMDVNAIVQAAETFQNTEQSEHQKRNLEYMTQQMDRYLKSQADYVSGGCTISLKHCISRVFFRCCGRRHGNYLVVLYLFVKILFIVNVLGQLFTLNAFLGTSFHFYGIDVLMTIAAGEDWTTSARFPRVTMCDFKVRRLGNVQRYTVQCVLPINLFNEKIYLFVWFWMVFLAAISCLSLLRWGLRCLIRSDRYRFIRKHLILLDRIGDKGDQDLQVRTFTEEYLRQDGCFVLRLVGSNTNAITVTEFICELWDKYRAQGFASEEEDESPDPPV